MFRIPFLAVLAFLTAMLAGCVSQEQYRRALADADNLRASRDAPLDYQKRLETENGQLRARVAELEGMLPDKEWLEEQKRRMNEILKGGALPIGVTLESRPEGVVFNVEGEVLFASGKAELTAEGQRTLDQLAGTLTAQKKRLRVEGHTDNDPIRQSQWGTNLRLSVERGMAVAEYLKKAGVPEERVAVAGYGEFSPKAANDSNDGKRQNRRVEILIRSERSGESEK